MKHKASPDYSIGRRKFIILARISSPKQEREGLSLKDIQLPQLRQYAQDNSFDIDQEFVFQESADRKIRRRFDEMINYIKGRSDIAGIITYRVDRITRNFRDAVDMDSLRIDFGKELHFVHDRLILTAKTYGKDITDWDLKVFLAKQQINRLKDDAYDTMKAKLYNHELYGMAPYGYRNVTLENEKKWVEVDVFEAGIVKQIYDWYSTGAYSMLQISQKLKEDYDVTMGTSQVDRILKNPFYHGMMLHSGKLYSHKYDTIILTDLFEIVQDVKAGHNKKTFKYAGLPLAYRGLLSCTECGCTITPEQKIKKQKNGNVHEYVYYHCTEFKGKHAAGRIEEDDLTDQFAQIYSRMQISDADLQDIEQTLREAHEGKVQFNQDLFDHYTVEIKKYQNRIEQAYLDKLDGSITPDEYDKFSNEFRQKQQDYTQKLANLQDIDKDYYIKVSYLFQLAAKAHELFMGSEIEEKRELLQLTLQDLTFDGKKVHYNLGKPFDSIFDAKGHPVMGRLVEDVRTALVVTP